MNFTIEGPQFKTCAVCTPILQSLPDWFGLEDAIQYYSSEMDNLPTFLACESGQVLGFLSLKQHNPYSAEVFVMGVRQAAHRNGIGRALMASAEAWLRGQGVEYLQVKTLGPSHPDDNYAKTRAFYLACGFRALEEFRQIWDEHNPCLILVKRL